MVRPVKPPSESSSSFLVKIALPLLLVMVLLALSSLVLTLFSPKFMFRSAGDTLEVGFVGRCGGCDDAAMAAARYRGPQS